MKKLLLILTVIAPLLMFSQIQIGGNINGEAPDDNSGISVSLSSDGTVAAIGSRENDNYRGHVRVYKYNGSSWNQLGTDIDGEFSGDRSGYSVSLSTDGTIIAIGAYNNAGTGSGAGHVRVYSYNGTNWVQNGGDINAEAFGDNSGWSVSLNSDGSKVAIGAPGNDGNGANAGHVRVYDFNGTAWSQLGADMDGEAAGDNSGIAVTLNSDGTVVAIGAPFNDGTGNNAGHIRIYNYNGSAWVQKGGDIDGEAAFDQSGNSVSISSDGNTIAIGASFNGGNGTSSGHVRIYNFNGSAWVQVGTDINGEASGDVSGYSVSLSSTGNIVAIGARGNNDSKGHVRVYKNISGTWNQVGVDIDGAADSDYLGSSVSLSSDGSIVAVGAPGNDASFDSAGQVQVFNLSAVLSTNSKVLANFEMYPNPATTQFKINLKEGVQLKKATIYNQIGQFIKTETKSTIDVSKLSKGLYLVEIVTNKGKATKKLVVN